MNNFVPKCLGCKLIIVDTYIQALGGHYHKDCFVCQVRISDDRVIRLERSIVFLGMFSAVSDGFLLRTRPSTLV